jgi:small-conductance mechanosensitive channel
MRLTWRDGLATLLVAAAAVLYTLWATDALMPGVPTRWMTVIAFALGAAACTANQRELGQVYGATREGRRPSALYIALATALGIVMLVAGILAFVLASETMLATLVAAMAALWLIATGRRGLTGRHLQLRAHPAAH